MSQARTSPAERVPAGYAVVRALVRLLLAVFYRRVEVVGAEHLPARGPLIVAANHHNSVVDAMLLLARSPRRLRTLANAPLFKHPLIGPFLRALGALPVHRRQEAGNDPARNAALFTATTEALRGGGAILIFPEGRTQPEPVLLELRTGAARMLLAAAVADPAAVPVLLPVGLVFHDPGTFREGRALVVIGAPVPTAEAVARAASEPEAAARALTEQLAVRLRELIVEADDRTTLRLLGLVEELWREEGGEIPAGEAGRVEWVRRAVRTYRLMGTRATGRVEELRRALTAFAAELDGAGLAAAHLSRRYAPGTVVGFLLREGGPLLLGAPLAVLGVALHGPPYTLTGWAVRLIPHTDEEEATDKIAAGLVLYPLAWAAEGALALRLGGPGVLLAFLLVLLPVGFLALGWRERLSRAARETRAFLRFLRDREVVARLRARRGALAAELAELARLAPEIWPEPPDRR